MFSISASLYLVAFFYGVFVVKEVDILNEKQRLRAQEKGLLADFFDREHVMETFRVAFKIGERQRRLRVIMLMIVVMVVIGPLHGKYKLAYSVPVSSRGRRERVRECHRACDHGSKKLVF